MQSRQKLSKGNTAVSSQSIYGETRHYNEASNGESDCRQVPEESNIVAPLFTSSVPESLVELERTTLTRLEIVQIIIAWLNKVGYCSSAELLHEEATAQLRGEYYARKTMRSLCRAIEEKNWDGAQKNLRKLQIADVIVSDIQNENVGSISSTYGSGNCKNNTDMCEHEVQVELIQEQLNAHNMIAALVSLVKSLPFLIAEQQFLELIDEDNGQQAFTFFMRNMKVFESVIAKEHFNRLTYLLTCRSVAEGAVQYEEYRGWTPQTGRLKLIAIIQQVENSDLMRDYSQQGQVPELQRELVPLSIPGLEEVCEKAISYDLLCQPQRLQQFHNCINLQQQQQEQQQTLQEEISEKVFGPDIAYSTASTKQNTTNSLLRRELQLRKYTDREDAVAFIRPLHKKLKLYSLFRPIVEQLPPLHPYILIDINRVVHDYFTSSGSLLTENKKQEFNIKHQEYLRQFTRIASMNQNGWRVRLTACDFVPDANAIVVAVEGGVVLWIPLNREYTKDECKSKVGDTQSDNEQQEYTHDKTSEEISNAIQIIHVHKQTVKGLRRHGNKLLCWGGTQAVIINLCFLSEQTMNTKLHSESTLHHKCTHIHANSICDSSSSNNSNNHNIWSKTHKAMTLTINTLSHGTDVYCGCFFPSGKTVLAGLSQGTVCLWDVVTCSKLSENTFTTSAIVSAVVNAAGTTYFAAAKEGVIRVIDVATNVIIFSLTAPLALELSSITLSHSSAYLLVAYKGGFIRIWDVVRGIMLPCRLFGAENNSRTTIPISFGNRDEFVFCGGEDGSIGFWDMRKPIFSNIINSTTNNNNVNGEYGVAREELQSGQLTQNANLTTTNSFIAQAMQKATRYPTVRIPLHKGCINDIKLIENTLFTCGEDGIVYICVGAEYREEQILV